LTNNSLITAAEVRDVCSRALRRHEQQHCTNDQRQRIITQKENASAPAAKAAAAHSKETSTKIICTFRLLP
jgi:hypothetical protein